MPVRFKSRFKHATPIGGLEQRAAVERCVNAIAIVLGVSRGERRQLTELVELAEYYRTQREECDKCCDEDEWGRNLKAAGVPYEAYAAFMVSERFDGNGPGRIRGENVPKTSRIVSVAERLVALTGNGSRMLSQKEALGDLEACAGSRYDPEVVHAARVAVEDGLIRF